MGPNVLPSREIQVCGIESGAQGMSSGFRPPASDQGLELVYWFHECFSTWKAHPSGAKARVFIGSGRHG